MGGKKKVPQTRGKARISSKSGRPTHKARSRLELDREIYSRGGQALKNYKKTKELFTDFYSYLKDREKKVPPLPLGERVRSPIDRYQKYHEDDSFPGIDSPDYIELRKYIEANNKMWESFTASRRSRKKLEGLEIIKKAKLELEEEVELLRSISKGFSINKCKTIPPDMKNRIKEEFHFLSNKKKVEVITVSCQLAIGFLMDNEAFREEFFARGDKRNTKRINDYVRSTFNRFHEIASEK